MTVGLYFGSFNPIHVGHLIIANYTTQATDLDEVWMVVSPHNPHKKKSTLLEDYHRLRLVREAIEDNSNLKASDIEFSLPQPSYTIDTLTYLKEKHPDKTFALIMGEDNLRTLHKWKNFEQIIDAHNIYVYPRAATEREESKPLNTTIDSSRIIKIDAPVMHISSSMIRRYIKAGKSVQYMLTEPVLKYVNDMHFYKR